MFWAAVLPLFLGFTGYSIARHMEPMHPVKAWGFLLLGMGIAWVWIDGEDGPDRFLNAYHHHLATISLLFMAIATPCGWADRKRARKGG